MRARILSVVLALLLSAPAWAQPVTVIGPVTPGNCAQFSSTTVIKDAGAGCGGGGGGGVSSINSPNTTLSITNPSGPTVSLDLNFGNTYANPSGNGQFRIGATSTQGGTFGGQGSVNDLTLVNKAGTGVCAIGTGQTALNCTALGLSTPLGFASGGTNAATQIAARNNMFPTPTRPGDVIYWNGSAWVTLPGNNSGTNWLQEDAAGNPSWTTPAGAASCTVLGAFPVGTGASAQCSNLSNSQALLTGGPFTINTTAGTTTKGLVINQTGPNTSIVAAGIDYNTVSVQDGINLGAGNYTSAFTIAMSLQPSSTGQKFGLYVQSLRNFGQTNMQGDQIAVLGFTQMASSNGGTDTGAGASGNAFGMNPIISATCPTPGSGATCAINYNSMVGVEIDRQIFANATTKYSFGLSLGNAQVGRGANLDAAINIGSANATGSWNIGVLFSKAIFSGGGVIPLQANTGVMIGTDSLGAGALLAAVINAPDYAFTNYFVFGNYVLTGGGIAIHQEQAAPAAPAAGLIKFWADSTDHTFEAINSSSVKFSMVPQLYVTTTPACTPSGTPGSFACTASLDTWRVPGGKMVCVFLDVNVTNIGTATGFVVGYPVTPKNISGVPAIGFNTGFTYQWVSSSGSFFKYDGTIPAPVAQHYVANGCYEAA